MQSILLQNNSCEHCSYIFLENLFFYFTLWTFHYESKAAVIRLSHQSQIRVPNNFLLCVAKVALIHSLLLSCWCFDTYTHDQSILHIVGALACIHFLSSRMAPEHIRHSILEFTEPHHHKSTCRLFQLFVLYHIMSLAYKFGFLVLIIHCWTYGIRCGHATSSLLLSLSILYGIV